MKKILLLLSLLTVSLILSCGKDSPLSTEEKSQRGTISGIVRDSLGKALSGVAVTLSATAEKPEGFTSVSDTAGRYKIADVPAGVYTMSFTHSLYLDSVVANMQVAKAEDVIAPTVALKMKHASLSGFVKDQKGNPVDKATVEIDGKGITTTTDSLGFYHFDKSLPLETIRVKISKNHFGTYYSDSIYFKPTFMADSKDFSLSEKFGTVSGVVSNSSKQVLAGIVVTTVPGNFSDTTDTNGYYSLAGLTLDQTYSLTFSNPNDSLFQSISISVSVSSQDLSLDQTVQQNFQRELNGVLTGNYGAVDSVIAEITGDSISGVSRYKLSLQQDKQFFTTMMKLNSSGSKWNAVVFVYSGGKRTGYASMPFDNTAGSVSFAPFDVNNAVPSVKYLLNSAEGEQNDPANDTTYAFNETAVSLKAPSKTGNTFVRWTFAGTDKEITELPAGTIENILKTGNLTIQPVWKANHYSVRFEGVSIDPVSVVFKDHCPTPEVPQGSDAVFAGWFEDQNHTKAVNFKTFTILSDTTIYVGTKAVPGQAQGKYIDKDGNEYRTVVIGNQEWMIENLRTTKYSDGSTIGTGSITDNSVWKNTTTPAYCSYNNESNSDSIQKYGLLYNWYVVSPANTKSIVNRPELGWHVPTVEEWRMFRDTLNANGFSIDSTTYADTVAVAASLANTSGWNTQGSSGTSSENGIGYDSLTNNSTGFSALPAGSRNFFTGEFESSGESTYWWSSTKPGSESNAYYCQINYRYNYLYNDTRSIKFGSSIRLVRNLR